MASLLSSLSSSLSSLNPINSFPDYHGQYAVGTVDVEIPISDLPSPSLAPEGAVETVAFRIFYPCERPGSHEKSRPVRWVAKPQKETISAFARFLGAKDRMASAISLLPQHLYWIKLPAHRNAEILPPPTSTDRWPVTVFSHGLAGSRNTYSYICGDLASHGMVVIALDHRDGSSPMQRVRATAAAPARSISPVKITHEPGPEAYEGRDKQLRIRLWEVSVAFEALMKIDAGETLDNLDDNTSSSSGVRSEVLKRFEGVLDIHRPGKVSWAGHSFGAATIVQLLKSVHYYQEKPAEVTKPLLVPNSDAAIVQQIMPESPALLLDMWCLPFRSPEQSWLYDRPLPSYSHGGPKGDNVLSVLSESFHRWTANRDVTRHIIAAPMTSRRPSLVPQLSREKGKLLPNWARLRDDSPSSAQDSGYASERSPSPRPVPSRKASSPSSHTPDQAATPTTHQHTPGPHMFYPLRSQHFNQSDFGILFPWLTRRFAKAEEPERIIDLNVRAMVQVARDAGIEVGGSDDSEILQKDSGIRWWISVPVADEVGALAAGEGFGRRLSARSQAPVDVSRDGETSMEM
nr:hypothetical protein B0A51_18769 [Rachicladosporium sp. CCFEE 5018]